MKVINIDFGVMRLFDVTIKHTYLLGEYSFDLSKDGRYLSVLDMKEYKLVKSKTIKNLYKVEKRD